jgi:hypothetical protein
MSVFFASSCNLGGLEPFTGKKAELPIMAMQFSQLASGADGTVSRAIVQGDGFLYIRTLGGPTCSPPDLLSAPRNHPVPLFAKI